MIIFWAGAIELMFRAIRWGTTIARYPRLVFWDQKLFKGHAYNRWALRPGVTFRIKNRVINVNELGFRGESIEQAKLAGTVRIFVLGGSSVFGAWMPTDDQTWPAVLQTKLRDRFPGERIEVINGGVPGATTADAITRLAFASSEFEPDIAILYESLNDALSNVPAAGKKFRHDYSHRQKSYCPPTWTHSVVISWMVARLGHRFRGDTDQKLAQNPLMEGIEVYARNLRLFAAVARAQGIVPVFTIQADRFHEKEKPFYPGGAGGHDIGTTARIMAAHRDALRSIAAELNIPVIDVHEALIAHDSATMFRDSLHLTPQGGLEVASIVADGVESLVFQLLEQSSE